MGYHWAPDDSYKEGWQRARETVARVVRNSVGVPSSKGEVLYVAARYGLGEGRVVEIGAAYGRSAIYLASGTRDGNRGKVWSVDPHTEYRSGEAFLQNLREADLINWVVPLVCTSREAYLGWDGSPIRVLFVDGDHSTSAAREDLGWWVPLVVPGGVVIVDDYGSYSSVATAVDEFCRAEGYEVAVCDQMAILSVKED